VKATLRDDDLFSLYDSFEEAGELGLGVVNVENSHGNLMDLVIYSSMS